MKVGLALGGGGAKAFAHIGVLEVLERERIPVHSVSGTSMGAVVAAFYALDKKAQSVKDNIFSLARRDIVKDLEAKFSDNRNQNNLVDKNPQLKKTILFVKELYLWNVRVVKKWLVDHKPFEVLFKDSFGDLKFSDCKIPLSCVATELIEGKEVYLESGLIREAVLASTALPGIFPPLRLKGKFLVDGCVLESLPVEALKRKKTNFIIAVSLEKKRKTRFLKSSMDILLSVDEVRHNKLNEIAASKADFLFEPDVAEFGWADFSFLEEIVDRGRQEAERKISSLKKALRHKRFFTLYI